MTGQLPHQGSSGPSPADDAHASPTDDVRDGFGLDAFGLDTRMRLFAYLAAEHRLAYVWVLRAFDLARTTYRVLLHTSEVAATLAQLRESDGDIPELSELELRGLLDQLVEWRVLDRAQDGARAATLAEYRNRHSVYQFTEAGYRAHRAAESVLTASAADVSLSRLVFADLLADLAALAAANTDGDAEEVYRKLNRVDATLAEVAERAARFYHMLGDLGRSTDDSPSAFLAHKDALLAHLRDFHTELQRYAPRLREAVATVEATGVDRLIEYAAEVDERVFRTPAQRVADWTRRWAGLRGWLAPADAARSQADQLGDATVAAIGDLLALLRRITESHRGGVSRESQLRHLAAWFAAVESEEAAHALFDITYGLGGPRHVGVPYPEPESLPTRASWWDSVPVELSRSLLESGRAAGAGNGRVAAIDRDPGRRARLRAAQLAEQERLRAAADALPGGQLGEPALDRDQARVLLRLLAVALAGRAAGARPGALVGAGHGVRLTLTPRPGTFTTVPTVDGALRLDGYAMAVTR